MSTALDSVESHPWYLAAQLLQPALLRLIDQMRQQVEASSWQGTYETVDIWPAPGEIDETTEPQILYWLHLTPKEQSEPVIHINLWELCYQICWSDYTPILDTPMIRDFQVGDVTADASLFAPDGDVDWHRLDAKAAEVVKQMLAGLPELRGL